MRKTLLLAVAMMAALGANAQGEKAYFAPNFPGISTSRMEVNEGTACGSTSIVDATIGATDQYKFVSVSGPKDDNGNQYKVLTIDGVSLSEEDAGPEGGGISGLANPKDVNNVTPAVTLKAPVSGAFFKFTAKADGYLYVVGKLLTNKAYTVFEDSAAIPYQYAQGADRKLPNPLAFDLTGTGTTVDGVENLTLADHPSGLLFPEMIIAGMAKDTISTIAIDRNPIGTTQRTWMRVGGRGVGYIAFPVFNGKTYAVNANGARLLGLGFYTSTEKAQNITLSTSDGASTITMVKDGVLQISGTAAGINKIAADEEQLNPLDAIYNLAGQRVSGAYRGVVIQNGHKFILK